MKTEWSTNTKLIHWLSVALIAAIATMGFVMPDLAPSSSWRLWMARAHTVLGAGLVMLTMWRIYERRRGTRPEPLDLHPVHMLGVRLVHGGLYAAILGLGLTGVATSATSAWPSYVLGGGEAPDFAGVTARGVHEGLVIALLVLIGLHVGGVLADELRRGGTLRRMVPKALWSIRGANA